MRAGDDSTGGKGEVTEHEMFDLLLVASAANKSGILSLKRMPEKAHREHVVCRPGRRKSDMVKIDVNQTVFVFLARERARSRRRRRATRG